MNQRSELEPFGNDGHPFWGWLVRLVVLSCGVAVASGLGVLVAVKRTSPRPDVAKPLIVRAQDVWNRVALQRQEQATTVITPVQEVQQLRQQVERLSDRTTLLESQLGLRPSQNALEVRLKRLSQSATIIPNVTHESVQASPLPGQKLKITLPTDLLFGRDRQLSPDGVLILDAILADLSQHEGATIRVAGHLDTESSPQANREVSFQMAQTVEQYLASTLAGQYRWIAVGYGQASPLVVTPGTQRNRRLEIAVD